MALFSGLGAMALASQTKADSKKIFLYGDGRHDDTEAIQAWVDGKDIFTTDGRKVDSKTLPHNREYKITKTITIDARGKEGQNLFNFNNSTLCAGRSWSNWFRPLNTMIRVITK